MMNSMDLKLVLLQLVSKPMSQRQNIPYCVKVITLFGRLAV